MPVITDEEYTEYRKWKETQEPEVSKEPAQEEFSTWPSISVGRKTLSFFTVILFAILSTVIWLCWPMLAGAVNQQINPGYQSPSIRTDTPVN